MIRYTYQHDSRRGRHWGKYGWTGPADLHSIYGSGEIVQEGPVKTALSGAVLDAIGKAEAEKSTVASIVAGARTVLQKYGALIDQYRGPIPASVVAVRIWIETRGNPNAGPTAQGEKGLLQIWPATATKYGVTNAYDPAQNLRAGLLHWNAELVRMQSKMSGYLTSMGYDFWAISQLYTMIGGGATPYLLGVAGVRPGSEYSDLVTWLKSKGDNLSSYAGHFGTQSAATVARRIVYAGTMTDAAAAIGGVGNGGLLILMGLALAAGFLVKRYWE